MRARFSLGYFIVALLLMILIQNLFLAETIHRIPYSEFKDLLRSGIESVTSAKMTSGDWSKRGRRGCLAALGSFSPFASKTLTW